MDAGSSGSEAGKTGWMREIRGLFFLIAGVFAFHGLAAKPYYVPTGSMIPTMINGDRIIVSKYPYGWSHASSPVHVGAFSGRLFGRMPERGDIVTVVRRGSREDLIKRVIGLPGETIAVRRGALFINGKPVKRVLAPDAMISVDANLTCDDPALLHRRVTGRDGRLYCRLPVYRETLPNGRSYDTIDLGSYFNQADEYGPVTVPEDHVFLMGDNRDNSADSRFALSQKGLGGPVPLDSIGGRAEFVTHSYDGTAAFWNPISWVTGLREGRAGTTLRPAG